jgi:hypothetical protein
MSKLVVIAIMMKGEKELPITIRTLLTMEAANYPCLPSYKIGMRAIWKGGVRTL